MLRTLSKLALAATFAVALVPGAARSEAIPIAVDNGGCELVVETTRPHEHFYLAIGSLADHARTMKVSVCSAATTAAVRLAACNTDVPMPWRELIHEQAARQERARQQRRAPLATPALAPDRTRVFHVFAKDRDLDNPANYATVTAELRAVGHRCQVYVDRDAAGDSMKLLIDDIVRTLDDEIFPWAHRHIGAAHDIDRDGRFTILLTPVLGKPLAGAGSVDGYVRGSDFSLDLAAPFSNRCDMMYLNSRLQPGPHLRTLLAHEYAHAVTYCEHVLENYLPGATRQDEEAWLNEGLSHLVEEQMGYGWSNLDYRIAAYLSWPERYPLVVPDYFHSGLWRAAGTRGASFLFLRCCRERHGLALLTRLSRSNLAGLANLEAATCERFEELFRRWAVTMLQQGNVWARKTELGQLCVGPRFHDIALAADRQEFPLVGTAILYLRLHAPTAGRWRIAVRSEEAARLQATLVRPDGDRPWLQLRCEAAAMPGRVKLHLTAHRGDVRIEAAACELLLPTGTTPSDTIGAIAAGGKTAESWFAKTQVKSGQSTTSREIALPESARAADLVFKVLARTTAGYDLAAWAVLHHRGKGPE